MARHWQTRCDLPPNHVCSTKFTIPIWTASQKSFYKGQMKFTERLKSHCNIKNLYSYTSPQLSHTLPNRWPSLPLDPSVNRWKGPCPQSRPVPSLVPCCCGWSLLWWFFAFSRGWKSEMIKSPLHINTHAHITHRQKQTGTGYSWGVTIRFEGICDWIQVHAIRIFSFYESKKMTWDDFWWKSIECLTAWKWINLGIVRKRKGRVSCTLDYFNLFVV